MMVFSSFLLQSQQCTDIHSIPISQNCIEMDEFNLLGQSDTDSASVDFDSGSEGELHPSNQHLPPLQLLPMAPEVLLNDQLDPSTSQSSLNPSCEDWILEHDMYDPISGTNLRLGDVFFALVHFSARFLPQKVRQPRLSMIY